MTRPQPRANKVQVLAAKVTPLVHRRLLAILQRIRFWAFPWPSASTGWTAVVLCLVAGYLVIMALQLREPYVIDEAAFPYAAQGILNHGGPFFYNGETRPNDLGMWHPPSYVYLLALDYAILGEGLVSTRIFGVIAVLIALLIGFRTIRRGFPTVSGMGYVVFAALLLSNPLVIAGSLVPDIDGTVGIVAAGLLTYLSISIVSRNPTRNLLLMSCLIWSFALLTKFTISLLFIPVIVLCVILADSGERLKTAVFSLAGILVGLATCFLVIRVTAYLGHFPADAPLDYFRYGLGRSETTLGYLDRVRKNVGPDGLVIYWVGGLFLFLPLIAVALCQFRVFTFARRRVLFVLGCTAYGILLAYLTITSSPFGFPKYWGVVIGPIALSAAALGEFSYRALKVRCNRSDMAGSLFNSFIGNQPRGAWSKAAVILGVFSVDIILGLQFVFAQERRASITGLACVVSVLVGLILFLVVSAVSDHRSKIDFHSSSAVVVLVALVTIFGFQLGQSLGNAQAGFSTRYYYGERGLGHVLEFINQNVPVDGVILSAKDIGQQSGRRFYEDAALFYGPPEEFDRLLKARAFDAIVTRRMWDYSEQAFPQQFAAIRNTYCPAPTTSLLDFQVWIRCSNRHHIGSGSAP